jgi:hypothetical protein
VLLQVSPPFLCFPLNLYHILLFSAMHKTNSLVRERMLRPPSLRPLKSCLWERRGLGLLSFWNPSYSFFFPDVISIQG